VLAVFKYYNFLNGNISQLLHIFHRSNPIPYLSILLPIGLSFHTFQAMSYTIEVYRGHQKSERNFGIYALYVMFYPQLVAGPIERPQNLLHQFYEKHYFEYERVVEGLKLVLWGFFKKIVIADRLAIYVNAVYNNPGNHNGYTFIMATIFFAFQIYCDFSGYSDIAIGIARIMGFKLMTNFNRPYFSQSVSEFWKRWHISLSTWFKDYLYISLGGNRVSVPRLYLNLMIVFLVSGLWHGANWTFIIWGGLNGFYLVSAIFFGPIIKKLYSVTRLQSFSFLSGSVNILLTFILSCFAWIFFRANNLSDSVYIIKEIFNPHGSFFIGEQDTLFYSVIFILFLLVCEGVKEYYPNFNLLNHSKVVVRYSAYTVLILLIILFGVFDGGQFIYFQF